MTAFVFVGTATGEEYICFVWFVDFFYPFSTSLLNTLRPRQNGRHFSDDIFKCIFLNENVWIPIKFSLKFVPKGLINNIPALVEIMAWRRPGDKPLSELMIISLPTHICVTRPQWVKWAEGQSNECPCCQWHGIEEYRSINDTMWPSQGSYYNTIKGTWRWINYYEISGMCLVTRSISPGPLSGPSFRVWDFHYKI